MMKVKEVIARLRELHPDATVFMPRNGFSLPIEEIEPRVGVYQPCARSHRVTTNGAWSKKKPVIVSKSREFF